ncbi:hypothetical protein FN846DRAFT_902094 [Sphaerosporella brunnea]|uniref:C3H1-type domain-containing protein n=1 Tax=Sphaerosporella brunnea TaxID=1250544 RepID=A0A5J5FB03_9PEZI|nr:hypothetical protein FN846DRAFT_902094 [Sphaerosporella brunnea]
MSAPTTRQTRSTRSTSASDGNTGASSSAAAIASAHQLSTEMEGSAIPPTTSATTDNPAMHNNVLHAVLAAFSPEERERALVRLLNPGEHSLATAPSASNLEGNAIPSTSATHVPLSATYNSPAAPATHYASAAHIAPAFQSTAATTNPTIASIHERYPAIDPVYIKEILENRFQPENIIKLSTSFSPTARRRETVTLGTIVIPTAEKDRDSQDYRGGLPSLMQPFEIYGQILCHFAPLGARLELQQALADYRDLLYTLNRTCTFESLKFFHFTFHNTRRSLGIFDPIGWRSKDTALQFNTLTRREDPTIAATRGLKRQHETPDNRRSPLSSGYERTGTPQTVCFDFNKGQCSRPRCSYKHICRHCYGAHPGLDHDRIANAEPDPNALPLGSRGVKR